MAVAPEDLSPARVAELMRAGSAQVVDVREPDEREAGRIPDDTSHIELDRLAEEAGSLDRERPVVFYCRSGSRSAMAAQAFAAAGFDAHNLEGGLEAWVADGLPLEPADGRVA
ncbi:MAG TPA: rhodanese-like domain-containing protein [Thermoleophilaceae bacterium]|nr:rhodanese-like domain-containing protein [Thermoleophilaceae bacterium]